MPTMVPSRLTSIGLLVIMTVTNVQLYQIMFEQFRRCTGHGIFECNVRVRKLNRTVAALYENVSLLMQLDDSIKTWIDAYHSPLGNNQYNKYPMKIPEIAACTFANMFWEDYYQYFVPYIPDIAKPKECPVTERVMQVNDLILDPQMLPPYVPTGLWKLIWQAKHNGSDRHFLIEATFKVYPNGHF